MGGTGVGLVPGGGSRGASAGGLGIRAMSNPSRSGCAVTVSHIAANSIRIGGVVPREKPGREGSMVSVAMCVAYVGLMVMCIWLGHAGPAGLFVGGVPAAAQ